MVVEVKLDMNAKEVDRFFTRVAAEYGIENADSAMVNINEQVIKPLRPQIRSATPRRTGTLRRTVFAGTDRAYINRTGHIASFAGYRFRNRSLSRRAAALVLEYGSESQPPRRTLQNVFNQNVSRMQSEWARLFGLEFEKLARKSAAGTKLKVR